MRDACFDILEYNKNTDLLNNTFSLYLLLFSLNDKKIPGKLLKSHGNKYIRIAISRITESSKLDIC